MRTTYSGHVTTFSAALGTGAVEVELGDGPVSLPFADRAITGPGLWLRSGDRVQVTLQQRQPAKPTVVSIERTGIAAARDSGRSPDALEFPVPVFRDGDTHARFSKEHYIRTGARLDFSPPR